MALAVHQFTVTDQQGNAVPFAHVRVRREIPGTPNAALKLDREGATALSNPVDADENGFVRFFVIGGAYQIKVWTGPEGAPTFEAELQRYVAIGLNSESDSISQRSQRIVTAAGAVTIDTNDADDVLIQKTVGEATTVNLPSAASRAKPVRIIDGKGDANTNNITIVPASGDTVFAIVDHQPVIDGNGGQLTLTPREDGTGWY